MVVGQVGSGKSSLLAAMMGEMHCTNGGVTIAGSVAYTSQEPWIQNATLRDNVVGMDPGAFDDQRYQRVLDVCALRPDLAILPGGDLAEIGEKGINISGGQKHRIALARAVYSDMDVFLLDDPLSAVDAHVSKHIFTECIEGWLGAKTRILVTHQIQFASQCDRIIVIKDGCVANVGTYDELCEQGVDFHHFTAEQEDAPPEEGAGAEPHVAPPGAPAPAEGAVQKMDGSKPAQGAPNVLPTKGVMNGSGPVANGNGNGVGPAINGNGNGHGPPGSPGPSKGKGESGKLVKAEERSRGKVKKAVYLRYIRSTGPAFVLPIVYLMCAFAERGFQVVQNFVLADWSGEKDDSWDTVRMYIGLYSLMALLSIVFLFLRAFNLASGTVRASRKMHMRLLRKVSSLPMSFFDSQPSGRLINRFTRDIESVDSTIGQSLNSATVCFISAFFAFGVVCFVTPLVILMVVPIIFIYVRVQLYYIGASRELKRLDSLAMSPIFSNFVETLQGLSVIRAFGMQSKFDDKNLKLIANANRCYWPLVSSNRWLSIRLEYLGNSITFCSALLSALYASRGNAGMSGLAITSAMNVTGLMTWMVRQMTELEVNMNSVERLTEYDALEEEGALVTHPDKTPHDWPHAGSITFDKIYVRYRPDLPNVLNGLSFTIKGGEKIGICGRTGCGKSTLMMTLYRIVEPSAGVMTIDGVDVGNITLYDLRSKLSLVPQDPVIFSGTVRSNLDPFNEAESDAEIWSALKLSGMKETIQDLPDNKGLDSSISENGGNLSVGQRQLLCMARALIRKSKILLLDEATSNVDSETDQLIQKTIRSAFSHCTVLTIAHRLHTIIDADRILALKDGRVAEFDTPKNLLKDQQGILYGLVAKATEGGIKKTKSASMLTQMVDEKLAP